MSSRDFGPDDLEPPILEVVLEPGDLLFMPRGFVHSARTVGAAPGGGGAGSGSTSGGAGASKKRGGGVGGGGGGGDGASLHLTISAGQRHAWADLLENMLPHAQHVAAETHTALRRSLPHDALAVLGVAHDDDGDDDGEADDADDDDGVDGDDGDGARRGRDGLAWRRRRRAELRAALRTRLMRVVEAALDSFDDAADQFAKTFVAGRLPPLLSVREERRTGAAGAAAPAIAPDTRLRMVRGGGAIARLVIEDGAAVVYHCLENARASGAAAPPAPLAFELDDAPAIEALLRAHPQPVRVADLPHPPHEDVEDKVAVATALFQEGFLYALDADEEPDDSDEEDEGGEEEDEGGDEGDDEPDDDDEADGGADDDNDDDDDDDDSDEGGGGGGFIRHPSKMR